MDHSLRCFFTLEHVTCFDNGGRIDCDVSFVDVANDAFFIDQESGAISKALLLIKDTIILNYSAFEIAEYRKRKTKLLCKLTVGRNTVDTQSKNLSFG